MDIEDDWQFNQLFYEWFSYYLCTFMFKIGLSIHSLFMIFYLMYSIHVLINYKPQIGASLKINFKILVIIIIKKVVENAPNWVL